MGLFDKIKGATEGIFSKKHTNETNESIAFCAKCGAPLQKGACFCSKCGSSVEPANITENTETRTTTYTGEILKCPNCGEILLDKNGKIHCSSCDYVEE